MTKMKDGSISRNYDYKKETSTSDDEVDGARNKIIRLLPKFFLLLILLAVGYYVYTVRRFIIIFCAPILVLVCIAV